MTSCSVIIVSYHTGPIVFATVKSVLRQRGLADIVFVNNGNRPDIFARLQQMALSEPRLKIISGQGNVGFAKAANMAVKQASGECIAFMDANCLLQPDTLTRATNIFGEIDHAMVVGCAVVSADGSRERSAYEKWQRVKKIHKKSPPPVREAHEAPMILPYFMCTRAADFSRLGGFDEQFFLQGADVDLCMRARQVGGKIIQAPTITLTHMQAFSTQAAQEDMQWHNAKGWMRNAGKHWRGRYFPGDIFLMRGLILLAYVVQVACEDVIKWWDAKRNKQNTVASKRLMILASGLAELSDSKEFADKTVFVTGATSEIGLCVVRRLIASGASVLGLSRGDPVPFEHEQLRWIKDDLDHKDCSLQGYYADVAVHCAPLAHLAPAVPMLAEAGVKRIIAFSSTAFFAKPMTRNKFERRIVETIKRAEANFEEAVKGSDIDWTILRPTMTYGVGLDYGVTRLYKRIRHFGITLIYPPALGRRHPVHADDLAFAVVQCAHNAATFGKSYNVSGGEIVSYRDMIERLFKLCHKKPRIIPWSLLPLMASIIGTITRKKHINRERIYRMNEDQLFFHDAAKKDFAYAPRAFLSGGIRDIEGI